MFIYSKFQFYYPTTRYLQKRTPYGRYIITSKRINNALEFKIQVSTLIYLPKMYFGFQFVMRIHIQSENVKAKKM